MDITPTTSAQGIQNAFEANAKRAERIAKPEQDQQFEKDMAELPSDPQNVAMNAAVIKTKDKMLGALMDVLA